MVHMDKKVKHLCVALGTDRNMYHFIMDQLSSCSAFPCMS